MYKTYENNSNTHDNIKYEEKIIPEEIKEPSENKQKKSISQNSFRNMDSEDLIILFLIFFLLREENNDNILYFILIALLFST